VARAAAAKLQRIQKRMQRQFLSLDGDEGTPEEIAEGQSWLEQPAKAGTTK
jgi:hypothetical protein